MHVCTMGLHEVVLAPPGYENVPAEQLPEHELRPSEGCWNLPAGHSMQVLVPPADVALELNWPALQAVQIWVWRSEKWPAGHATAH